MFNPALIQFIASLVDQLFPVREEKAPLPTLNRAQNYVRGDNCLARAGWRDKYLAASPRGKIAAQRPYGVALVTS